MTFLVITILLLFYIIKEKLHTKKIENYLNSILKIMNSIRYGNLSAKVDLPAFPKYKNITDSINRMIETLQDREQMILEYRVEEKEFEKLKEDFVATLTHDLKVPIIAEANMLEFLLKNKFGEINEKQRTALLNMQTSNKELVELVQTLLDTYKIKETGIELFKENLSLNEFMEEVVSEIQPTAVKHGIEIRLQCPENIVVKIDKMQFARVIKNLISNAILHANTQRFIDIKIKNESGNVFISVIDYGQGISPDKINYIFDKYYSATNKFRKIGTGLGLYLAKQIVLSHGGEITVTSEENIKTEFCIKLPN